LWRNLKHNNIKFHPWNHYYPEEINRRTKPGQKSKVIFLFANDPIEVVLSVKKREIDMGTKWVKAHFKNLKADFDDYPKIFHKDALHLTRMLDAYWKPQQFHMLTLKFEDMSKHEKLISQFIGQPFKFKEKYKPRPSKFTKLPQADKDALIKTYAPLKERVKELPGAKIWKPK
jgi:hypothetical protein